ncbi:MAG: RNA polymerase sigma factor, partial [Anaerolineales bacterium]
MDTEEWIDELSQSGEAQEVALRDLRAELESGLPYALSRWLSPNDPGFSLIQESIQEALLKVLEKLESFDGRSKFTTWVYKIAIHEALSELRRKRWQNVSLEELLHTEED